MLSKEYFMSLSKDQQQAILKVTQENIDTIRNEAIKLQQLAQDQDYILEEYNVWIKEDGEHEDSFNTHRRSV